MAIAIGANQRLAFFKESTYGVNPGGTAWLQMPFISLDFGASQNLIDSNVIGIAASRDPADPFYDSINVDGTIEVPLDKVEFGRWLQQLFGNPTTTNVAADYTHVFKSGAAALPSCALEVGSPDLAAPQYLLALGVRASTLSLTTAPTGRPQARVGLVGQGATRSGTTVDASLTAPAGYEQFNNFQAALTRNGSALASITAMSLNFSNGIEPLRTIRADQKIDEALPGDTSINGTLTARYADPMLVLATDSEGTTPVDLRVTYTISATRSIEFRVPRAFLPRAKSRVEGRGGVSVDYQFQGSFDAAQACAFMVTLKNQQVAY